MTAAVCIAMIIVMSLALIRAWRGPSVFDRILAVNVFGTVTVLFIALLGFAMGRPAFLDMALLYALINFIGTVAVLKLFQYGDLGHSGEDRSG